MAVAAAVDALVKLHTKETMDKLMAFAQQDASGQINMSIRFSDSFLRSSDPSFWFRCFVRLFPRGDCMQRCSERTSLLSEKRWTKCLLTRVDFRLWSCDVEFVASLYNIQLRNSQIHAVTKGLKGKRLSDEEAKLISETTAMDLMSAALASGDVNDVRAALRKKGLDLKLRTSLLRLRTMMRDVRGSEAERDDIIPKFIAMRIWNGCSSLFFTLNPHDIRSPVSLMLLQGHLQVGREFSLDLSDEETEQYLADFLQDNPRRLHQFVASHPMVATIGVFIGRYVW